jgi:AhpC/TSA family protein
MPLIGLLVAMLAMSTATLARQYSIADQSSGETEMIGKSAPSWAAHGWINSEPLDIRKLRGNVILIRFFDEQPVGASALRQWRTAYHDKGFIVVGFYVASPMPGSVSTDNVRGIAESLGFDFPVGNDSAWETANRYWLNRTDSEPGGMTFLVDRKGIIRYIQPDGRYEKNAKDRKSRAAYDTLEKQIQSLLSEAAKDPDGGK